MSAKLAKPCALLVSAALAASLPLTLHAKTFRFARAANMSTWDAHAQNHELVSHIPLHNQVIPWAMKKTVDLLHRADNLIEWRALKVN